MTAVPTTLISGYLGAGKTTLVNSLLRQSAGRRLAVLVNDFGTLPIDADLIEAQDGNLVNISGGCICCSYGDDLTAALLEMTQSGRAIDHFLIETSGVALPKPITQTLMLLPGILVNGIVTLADAQRVRECAGDKYMGDTIHGQLAVADIVILSKVDLVPDQEAADTIGWLVGISPRAQVLSSERGDLPAEAILGEASVDEPRSDFMRFVRHGTRYETINFESEHPADVGALADALTARALGLLRAKGFVKAPDGKLSAVHVVGDQRTIEPAPPWVSGASRLVCIGLAKKFDKTAVQALLERHFHTLTAHDRRENQPG